jgi:carotenoid cleavage dioxygenase-like enzyme
MIKRDFSSASRNEVDITLNVISGAIPEDLHGVVFINSGCGTVNTKGMPYPSHYPDGSECQEYGSPLINGDGLMIRVDFTESGKVGVKTGLLKAPCYYADLATSPQVSPGNPWEDLKFNNLGLARISMSIGTRNELNTAITPVKFSADNEHRLLATFDAGRPFEFDPANLNIVTAIGQNKIWNSGLPPFLNQPLAMVLTTAHPVFDPATQELFTVNFTKTDEQMMKATHIFDVLFHDGDWLKSEFKKLILSLEGKSAQEKISATEKFLSTAHLKSPKKNPTIWQKIINCIKHEISNLFYKYISNRNAVKVLRWEGQTVLDEWTIVDENGDAIAIDYNMHQIGFSKDYLVLCDTNFKFTLDVMINFPFQNEPIIDSFIREILGGAMNDYSHLYLVKRSDLNSSVKTVKATTTKLPLETVHFSVNYQNPNNQVTIHTAHNCSACPAEWLRSYDTLATSSTGKIDMEKIGLIAVGEMDIGKIGKVVVDATTGKLIEPETKYLYLTGEVDGQITAAHTWAIGLYTYKNMLSPDENVDEIEHIFWQSYGLREDCLTTYIYDLYKDPKRSRTFKAEEMAAYTKMGARFVLQCIETAQLTSTDFYTFAEDQFFWSIQFVPNKKSQPGVPESKNGYILTTVITGTPMADGQLTYSCEIWLFDANNLAKGPVCKLAHPDLSIGFTIHSVWVPEAKTVTVPSYKLNVVEDYNEMISKMSNKNNLRDRTQALFDQKVYPHFN